VLSIRFQPYEEPTNFHIRKLFISVLTETCINVATAHTSKKVAHWHNSGKNNFTERTGNSLVQEKMASHWAPPIAAQTESTRNVPGVFPIKGKATISGQFPISEKMTQPSRSGILPSTPITMARGFREPPMATSYNVQNTREPCPAWDKTEITNNPLYMGITEIFEKYDIVNTE
jgi:hypothetical protein